MKQYFKYGMMKWKRIELYEKTDSKQKTKRKKYKKKE